MAKTLIVLLILFGAIMLINLLIAMMAQTYDTYAQQSAFYFSLNLGDFIVRYDKTKLSFHSTL